MSDIPTTTARLVLDVGDAEQQIESLGTAVDDTTESFERMADPLVDANVALEEGTAIITDHVAAQLELAGVSGEVVDQYLALTEAYAQGAISEEEYVRAGTALNEQIAESNVQVGELDTTLKTGSRSLNQFGTGALNAAQAVSQLPGPLGQVGQEVTIIGSQAANASTALNGFGVVSKGAALKAGALVAGLAVAAYTWDRYVFSVEEATDGTEEFEAAIRSLETGLLDLEAASLVEGAGETDLISTFVENIDDLENFEQLLARAGIAAEDFNRLLGQGAGAGVTAGGVLDRSFADLFLSEDEVADLESRLQTVARRSREVFTEAFQEEVERSPFLTDEDRGQIFGEVGDDRLARLEAARELEQARIDQAIASIGTDNESANAREALAIRTEEYAEQLAELEPTVTGLAAVEEAGLAARIAFAEATADAVITDEEYLILAARTGLELGVLGEAFNEQQTNIEEFNESVRQAGVAFRDEFLPTIGDAIGEVQAALEEGDPINFESILFAEGVGLGETDRFIEASEFLVDNQLDALQQRLNEAGPEARQQLVDQIFTLSPEDLAALEDTADQIDFERVVNADQLEGIGEQIPFDNISEQINSGLEDAVSPDLVGEAQKEADKLAAELPSFQAWSTAEAGARTAGQQIGGGLADGITDSTDEVTAAAAALGDAAQAALDAELQIESPSQTAAESGRNFTAGFVQGATEGDTINVNVTSPSGSDPQLFGRSVGQAVRSVRRR